MAEISDKDYEAFRAFQRTQEQIRSGQPAGDGDSPEGDPLTLRDVLKAFVHASRLPSENHARAAVDAIDRWFDEYDATNSPANRNASEDTTADEVVPDDVQ